MAAIVATSLVFRLPRSKGLRFECFEFHDEASEELWERLKAMEFPVLVPRRPGRRCLTRKE